MFSSSGALRALSVAALFSSVLSLPNVPVRPAKRSLQEYVDHLVYLDASKSSLYSAIEIGGQTYGAHLDNNWGGLVVKNDSSSGSTTQINVEGVAVTVSKGHESIGFLQEDIEIDYYSTSQWPKSWPTVGSAAGVGAAKIGIDITDSKSVMNEYLAAKWSSILDNWYYDLLIFFDWETATSQQQASAGLEFAGIITTGATLDWASVFDISAGDVSKYGLPDLSTIKDQPYIYLRPDGTFYVDNNFYPNGNDAAAGSGVPQTPASSLVVQISLTERFSTFPQNVAKGLYAGLSGAKYYGHSTYGYYQVSCDAKVSFYFTIGGKKYEVSEEALIAPNPWGEQCIGTIFTTGHASASTQYDVVFGFQFLSSFYYRAGISHSSNQAYIKLLPLPSPDSWGSGSGTWKWSGSGSGVQYSESPVTTSTKGAANNQGSWQTSTAYGSAVTWGDSTSTAYGSAATWATGSGTAYNSAVTWASGSGTTYGSAVTWGSGNGNNGNGNNGWQSAQPSTSTIFTTTTHTIIGTTTVAWPASGTSYASVSTTTSGDYSGSGSGSGSGTYSGSGYNNDSENLAVAGNVAETDADGNDLNLPHGSLSDKLKHCLPAIIVLAAVLGLGLVIGLIACLVRRRRGAGGARPSAYRNLHEADSHAPVHVPLYGAEEGQSRYSDPYQDKA